MLQRSIELAFEHLKCRRMVPWGGEHVATTFYILFGWLLFNFAFAVGMYFRPKRKRPIDLIEGCTPEDTADLGLGPPGSDEQCFRGPHSVPHKARLSLPLARILFFGFWLRDPHHSASGADIVRFSRNPPKK
jgi:hypothetical protein